MYVAGRIVDLQADDLADIRRLVLRHNQRNRAMPAVREALAARGLASLQPATTVPRRRAEFAERFLANDDVADFLDDWWPVLDPREVLLWLADEDRARRYTDGLLDAEQAAALRRSYTEHNDFSIEDVALVDELAYRLGTPGDEDEDDDDEAPPAPATDSSVEFDDPGLALQELSTWQDRNASHRSDFTDQARSGSRARSRTSSWTRRRTCRRCSGACSAAAAGTRAGRSSVTRPSRPGATRGSHAPPATVPSTGSTGGRSSSPATTATRPRCSNWPQA